MPLILLSLILAPTVVALIAAHKFVAGVIAWLLFSSLVDGMPAPSPTSGLFYRWLHGSLNLLAGNAKRALCALVPRFAGIFGEPTSNTPGTEE